MKNVEEEEVKQAVMHPRSNLQSRNVFGAKAQRRQGVDRILGFLTSPTLRSSQTRRL